jgi:competence protein ComEC
LTSPLVTVLRDSLLLACLLLAGSLASAQELELHFIDVGQGDAVLIRGPDGKNVVYDGGRSSNTVLGYLRNAGVTSLDLVIASHADADHIGGLIRVVEAYRPRYFLDNGIAHTTQTYRRLLEAVEDAGSLYLEPTARSIAMGIVTLRVLPPPGDPGLGQNDNSVGLLVEFGEFRALFTGDAAGREFEWWKRTAPELLTRVTVYKASHHGSDNGDTTASMSAFRPETVIISVGLNNAYGHPTETASRLYRSVASQVFRTDIHGSVLVQVGSDGSYLASAEREAPALPFLALAVTEAAVVPEAAAVVIECILFDPEGRDDGREIVTLTALKGTDLSGWWLEDEADHLFALPPVTLESGESLDVANGGRPAWNNDGDTAFLYDSRRQLVDSLTYTGAGSSACR